MSDTPRPSKLTAGDVVIEVRDTALAVALYTVGIPLFDETKPFKLMAYADGTRRASWKFRQQSLDGKYNTEKLCKAIKDPDAWFKANPEHPFSYALYAALRSVKFNEAVATRRALTGWRIGGGKTMYVFENSRKFNNLVRLSHTSQGVSQI